MLVGQQFYHSQAVLEVYKAGGTCQQRLGPCELCRKGVEFTNFGVFGSYEHGGEELRCLGIVAHLETCNATGGVALDNGCREGALVPLIGGYMYLVEAFGQKTECAIFVVPEEVLGATYLTRRYVVEEFLHFDGGEGVHGVGRNGKGYLRLTVRGGAYGESCRGGCLLELQSQMNMLRLV